MLRQFLKRILPARSSLSTVADAFQQAFDAGLKGGRARLIVDRDLCRACGRNGGVKGMARQLDLEELEVISPSSRELIKVK